MGRDFSFFFFVNCRIFFSFSYTWRGHSTWRVDLKFTAESSKQVLGLLTRGGAYETNMGQSALVLVDVDQSSGPVHIQRRGKNT